MAASSWLRLHRLRQRFHVRDQRVQLLFAHQSLERRHDGLESVHDLRAGIENRFANIVFVGGDGAAVFKLHRLAEDSLQIRTAALRVGCDGR